MGCVWGVWGGWGGGAREKARTRARARASPPDSRSKVSGVEVRVQGFGFLVAGCGFSGLELRNTVYGFGCGFQSASFEFLVSGVGEHVDHDGGRSSRSREARLSFFSLSHTDTHTHTHTLTNSLSLSLSHTHTHNLSLGLPLSLSLSPTHTQTLSLSLARALS